MESKNLKWCFKLKNGLNVVEPNKLLADSYLKEAKSSLERADKNFKEKDLLWTTVIIYYSEYYALYSFLQRIGVKCENHHCSILAAEHLLGEEKIKTIDSHKDKRIDAQYYMKTGKEKEVEQMLKDAKIFISSFDELVSNLTEEEVNSYRENLNNAKSDKKKEDKDAPISDKSS